MSLNHIVAGTVTPLALECKSLDCDELTVGDLSATNLSVTSLTATTIDAGTITGGAIQGGVRVTTNPLVFASFTPLPPSSGIIGPTIVSSCIRVENTMVDSFKARQLSASLSAIAMVIVPNPPAVGGVWEYDMTIPFGESMTYPAANGLVVPGGGAGTLVNTVAGPDPLLIPVAIQLFRKSATVMTIQLTAQDPNQFAAPGRSAAFHFTVNYLVA